MAESSGKQPARKRKGGKRLHFVTYSQVDFTKFPTRHSFGNMLHREFDRGDSKAKVKYWACAREKHSEGEGAFHYHCALLLTDPKRWGSVADSIYQIYDIRVNFSDGNEEHDANYIAAYRYLSKEDEHVCHSDGHPNLEEAKSPATKYCIAANRRRQSGKVSKSMGGLGESSSTTTPQPPRKVRLTDREVGNFIVKHEIRTYKELLAIADEREEAGEHDLAEFVWKRREEWLMGCIKKAWDKANARQEVDALKKHDRLDLLIEAKTETLCICDGLWLKCAKEVLALNDIDESEFAQAIHENLIKGRGKFRNVLLVGKTNRAKTFLLKPLRTIYGRFLFENPACHKYGWGGCRGKSVFLLQDFRWNVELIKWSDFLLMLDEDETVKLPTPRNHEKEDIVLKTQVAIFATSVDVIKQKVPYYARDEERERIISENSMMQSRWKVFRFRHEFTEENQIKCQPCAHCFARLVLQSPL